MAKSEAVPKPNSSAPRIAAIITSRENLRPPSTRREIRERRPARTKVSCVSRKPISQGKPVFLMEYEYRFTMPELAQCVAYFDQVAAELARG